MPERRETRGRPPRSGTTRTERLALALTREEKARYRAAAVRAGVSLADWMRAAAEKEARR